MNDTQPETALAAIRERLDKITPGTWQATIDDETDSYRVCNIEDEVCVCCLALMGDYDHETEEWADGSRTQWVADTEFIAAAPADIRFLLDALAASEQRRQAAEGALANIHNHLITWAGTRIASVALVLAISAIVQDWEYARLKANATAPADSESG